ncbi:MAG: NADH-quinone oxidoreductase subunit C [Gammaproteobacteria bacterium]|nr:NADH-quinone oxidoreductase subunit C [Gammaproteobacteria bacterium]MDH5653058.1 NADH-quinone oxidoreductase subunit C [Gammaproteobacteria bacterium]
MSEYYQNLVERLRDKLGAAVTDSYCRFGEATIVVDKDRLSETCITLRDNPEFAFAELIDLCGVDYSDYGHGSWKGPRFGVSYHLLSIKNNHRLRVKTFTDGEPPMVSSVINIWRAADWFEREAFDLYGIVFEGHPDLRRILTDYGFIGHPFRKDFPLNGHVEMRYDPEKQRVVYQPVSIEARVNQPRVIRDDHRYAGRTTDEGKLNG